MPSRLRRFQSIKLRDICISSRHIVANVQNRIPNGEVVGYYTLHYSDDEHVRLPIRYGQDVVPWVFTRYVKPTRSCGMVKGAVSKPQKPFRIVSGKIRDRKLKFDPSPSNRPIHNLLHSSSLFRLSQMILHLQKKTRIKCQRRLFGDPFLVQGQTEQTRNAVDALSQRASNLHRKTPEISYRRARCCFKSMNWINRSH